MGMEAFFHGFHECARRACAQSETGGTEAAHGGLPPRRISRRRERVGGFWGSPGDIELFQLCSPMMRCSHVQILSEGGVGGRVRTRRGRICPTTTGIAFQKSNLFSHRPRCAWEVLSVLIATTAVAVGFSAVRERLGLLFGILL